MSNNNVIFIHVSVSLFVEHSRDSQTRFIWYFVLENDQKMFTFCNSRYVYTKIICLSYLRLFWIFRFVCTTRAIGCKIDDFTYILSPYLCDFKKLAENELFYYIIKWFHNYFVVEYFTVLCSCWHSTLVSFYV